MWKRFWDMSARIVTTASGSAGLRVLSVGRVQEEDADGITMASGPGKKSV